MTSRRAEIADVFLKFGEPVDTSENDAAANPDFVRLRDLAYFDADWRQGPDYAGAIHHLRQALALAPKLPKLWFQLGEWLQETGDRDGAIAAFREGLKYDPAHGDAATRLKSLGASRAALFRGKARNSRRYRHREDRAGGCP